MQETKPNKPIALAVTLVILVICLMLNIVFISKNIALKQEKQLETGYTIVTLMEKIEQQSTFIDVYLNGLSQEIKEEAQLHGHANDILKHELALLNEYVAELFFVTSQINGEVLSEHAREGNAPKLLIFLDELEKNSYIDDIKLTSDIQTTVNDIKLSISEFNFKLAESKTAMIRMSNGFEWTDTLQLIDEAVANNSVINLK